MEKGRVNIIVGSIIIIFGGIGGFLLGNTLDGAVKDGLYSIPFVRIFFRGSHTHGLLMAFYNLIYGLMIDRLALSDRSKRIGSVLAIGSLLLPLGLGLRGLTEGSMAFAPLGLIGGILFMVSAGYLLAGAWKKRD